MKLKHKAFVTWGHESKSWLNEGVWNPFQERLIRKVSLEWAAAAHGYWSLQDNVISSSYHFSSSEISSLTPLFTRLWLFCWCVKKKKKSLLFLKYLGNSIGKMSFARTVRFLFCPVLMSCICSPKPVHLWVRKSFPRGGKISPLQF